MSRLPLFPLGTVLFPGVLLPLHVFEERYRQLVADLLATAHEERAFGVVAIREGHEVGVDGVRALHAVGCVARLRRVEPYADGRFDVVTTGTQRFRLDSLDDGKQYLQGEVTLLDDRDGTGADELAVAVARAWQGYRDALGSTDEEVPDDARALSYLVAAGTVLDLAEKQRLLEAEDTATRLARELALLRRETALLGMLPSLPAVELTRAPASPN